MIGPLLPFPIRGVIWYQGEANAGDPALYRTLFPALIRDWRRAWQQDFPFLFVQLAPWRPGNSWPALREVQLHTSQTVPNTTLAVITDVGDETDIHPRRKAPVGQRLALAARALAYGETIEFRGPVFRSLEIKGHRTFLSFDHVAGGLVASNGPLTGFTVAGSDQQFLPATAEIIDETVAV